MKLLRTIATLDPDAGGPVEGLRNATRLMVESGVDVEVACVDSPDRAAGYPAPDCPVHALGPGLGTYAHSARFKRWMEDNVNRFDAVIVHGCWQYHGHATSRVCRRWRVPYFVFPHGMLDPWFNRTYPVKKLKKTVYWALREHAVLSRARAVLFTTERECRLARDSFRPYRITEQVPGYGTLAPAKAPDELAAAFAAERHPWHNGPFLLYLGRIHEKKGVDLLVQAYSEARRRTPGIADLVIAGPVQSPALEARLRQRFEGDGIVWTGALPAQAKWPALAAAEALILPSHQENFGLAVAEAMATGTPVLISDQVNISDAVEQGGAGLVEPDTLDGTRRLIARWTALGADERAAMGRAARQVFDRQFDLRRSTERLVALLSEETGAAVRERPREPRPAPRFSVIIPTYDRPRELARALASCTGQTAPPDEVLVLDNGANPETREVVDRAAAGTRIALRRIETPKFDVRAALAEGIASADGDWLILLDDDDFLAPGRIAADRDAVDGLPADRIVLLHDFVRVNFANHTVWEHRLHGKRLDYTDALTIRHFPPPGAATWRAEPLRRHHPFGLAGGWNDFDLYASMLQHGRHHPVRTVGYAMDDTRVTGRQTTHPEQALEMIRIHRERYRDRRALSDVSDAGIDRALDRQVAFYNGKLRGPAALAGPDRQVCRRHAVAFAKGLASPLRGAATRIAPNLIPAFHGSVTRTLGRFERHWPEEGAWIRGNALPR